MNTATKLMKIADDKAEVVGTYHGAKFTGKAKSSRQITVSPYPEQIWIETEPFEVLGRIADSVLICSDDVDAGKHTVERK